MRIRNLGLFVGVFILAGSFYFPMDSNAQLPLTPAQKQQADKLAQERLQMQLRASGQRKQEEQARAEQLRKAQGVNVAPKPSGNQSTYRNMPQMP